MKKDYTKWYSEALGREMEMQIFGQGGHPILFIPCQDGKFVDFENFNMTDTFSPWLESGKCTVFSIDTIDLETYSNTEMPAYDRIRRHEAWVKYITDEVVPYIHSYMNNDDKVLTFGCSLGATHAANLYLRRPDIFDGCMALSGIFTTNYGFGDYMDELVYMNSPVDYMANFPEDHEYMDMYRNQKAVICCGTGAWEQPDTTFRLKEIFEQKNIPIWVDIWGSDVNHDWPWWHKQAVYFLPFLLGE